MPNQTNVTRYMRRSLARMAANPSGAFRLAEVVDADDLAALERAGALLTFLRVVGPSFEMSAREASEMDGAIAVLENTLGHLRDPAVNWRGDDQ